MHRLTLLSFLIISFEAVSAQNNLPTTYIFDESPTSFYAQTIVNDTIVCMGAVFKEGDTINYQQGAFIAFIDSCGSLIRYRKYFDADGRDIILNLSNKIIRTEDGGYCFVGSIGLKKLILKTDSRGDSVFMREYAVPVDFEYASYTSIHEINNALYVIGFGGTGMPVEDDLFMLKFDFKGDSLGYWRFKTTENCEYFQDAVVKGNNIVVSAAQTNACVSAFFKSKTRIFEVDTTGNKLWDWVDNNSNLKRGGGLGLKSCPDGGWVYAGTYNDTMIGAWPYSRLFITKIDSLRNHEWTNVIGYLDMHSYNSFTDIVIDTAGNYIVAGQYETGNPDFPDPFPATSGFVAKISPLGEIIWTNIAKAYENSPENGMLMFTTNINLLSSGNIIIGGYLYRLLPLDLQNEGWLAKLSPSGEVLDDPDPQCGFVSVQQPKTEIASPIFCYPNPAGDFVQFDLSRIPAEMRCGQITVYDLMGKTIAYKLLASNTENIVIDIRSVPEGIYLYQMACEHHKLHSGKFMVKK